MEGKDQNQVQHSTEGCGVFEPSQNHKQGTGNRNMSWWKVTMWDEPEGKVEDTHRLPVLDSWETEALSTASTQPLFIRETDLPCTAHLNL